MTPGKLTPPTRPAYRLSASLSPVHIWRDFACGHWAFCPLADGTSPFRRESFWVLGCRWDMVAVRVISARPGWLSNSQPIVREMDRQKPVQCAVQQLAVTYKERAEVFKACLYHDEAARYKQIAEEILEAKAQDDDVLLPEEEAIEHSRGYTPDHLRRSVRHTTDEATGERLYRKGDLPRKAVTSTQTVEHTNRGTRVRIED